MNMNHRTQMLCVWGGYGFLPFYALGFIVIAGFIPAIPPSWNAAELAKFVDENRTSIRIGMNICMAASALFVPFTVVLFEQMTRMEEGFPRLAYSGLIAGIGCSIFFFFPTTIWSAITFRPDANPETMLILDDLSWLCWMLSLVFFDIQLAAVGFCALMCKPEKNAIIPRWLGYLSFITVLSFFPAFVIPFLKTGPFAWNGMIALYIPLVIYAAWFQAIFNVCLRAYKRQQAEDIAAAKV